MVVGYHHSGKPPYRSFFSSWHFWHFIKWSCHCYCLPKEIQADASQDFLEPEEALHLYSPKCRPKSQAPYDKIGFCSASPFGQINGVWSFCFNEWRQLATLTDCPHGLTLLARRYVDEVDIWNFMSRFGMLNLPRAASTQLPKDWNALEQSRRDNHDSRFGDIISFSCMMGQHAVWRLTFSIGIFETNYFQLCSRFAMTLIQWPGIFDSQDKVDAVDCLIQRDVWCGRSKDLLRISTELGPNPSWHNSSQHWLDRENFNERSTRAVSCPQIHLVFLLLYFSILKAVIVELHTWSTLDGIWLLFLAGKPWAQKSGWHRDQRISHPDQPGGLPGNLRFLLVSWQCLSVPDWPRIDTFWAMKKPRLFRV